MGPSNPFLKSSGRLPEWSMCAWVKRTKSISPAVTGSFWFSKMSFPCSMPQSTRPRLFPHSMSVQLPVTSWVAPKKVTFIANSRVAALPQPFAGEKPPIFTENIIHVPRPSRKTYCIPLPPYGFLQSPPRASTAHWPVLRCSFPLTAHSLFVGRTFYDNSAILSLR